uniref:Uncharacterized protein n=1 Tax=Arundo donax TaxID=35708 RepID=A0A0A9A2R2_ARUDO
MSSHKGDDMFQEVYADTSDPIRDYLAFGF